MTGPLVAGAVVTDVAKVGPEFDQTPIGGSVSFTFFSNGSCNSPGTKAGTAPLIAGTAISLSEGPLGVGTYSFQATYNGDHDYAASIGGCEPFSVGPDIITKVYDAAGGTWTGDEVTGSSAYDTAVVSPRIGNINPTGSVTYTFFDNGTCASGEDSPGVVWTEKVSLSGGLVPNSKATAPLTAGSYSFSATYSGSLLYASSTGACEPFTLGKAATAVTTAVEDAAGGAAWRGSEATGSSAYDTATVGPEQDHTVITGTVTYQLFTNGSCAGSEDAAPISDTVTLNPDGSVPNSTPEGPLGAGPWSFLATYSGDSNYAAAVGGCEPLTVGTAATTVTSAVTDPANGGVWQDSELAGASAYDTAAVAPEQDDTPITGTVSYQFFGDGTCTGMSVSAGTVTMSDGTVPQSDTEGPLAAGHYSFLATYSGDSNYAGSIGSCEPLTVNSASTPTPTAAATPTPTPTTTPTPTATPFGGVLGITTPGTGAGSTSSLSWLGILLILLGTALVALARLPRSDGIRIEDV